MGNRPAPIAAAILFLLVLLAPPALAHKLKIFATAVGDAIDGTVYFVGGSPATGARIVVTSPAGKTLAELTSDAEGRFAMTAAAPVDHIFTVDSGDGHTARFIVSAAELGAIPAVGTAAGTAAVTPPAEGTAAGAAAVTPPAEGTAGPAGDRTDAALRTMVEDAVARQIRPLREDINAYEDQVRLRDIAGGIGFIVGLAGIALWFRSRAPRPAKTR